MIPSREDQDTNELIDQASGIVQEEQVKLREISEKARSLFQKWSEERRELELALQQSREKLATAWTIEARAGSRLSDRRSALEQEEAESLRQSLARLSARVATLQRIMQRLAWLARQAENTSQLLPAESEASVQDDGQMARLVLVRALQAQETERQRLAREIHDGPAQVLANAIFELEYCDRMREKEPDRLPKELERLKSDLKEGLAEVRNFIFDLRAAPLAEIGLAAMLRHYTQNFQSRFNIPIEVEVAEVGRLPAAQETAIYRIVQEALQNVQKHSRASKIKFKVERSESNLIVSVEDNGVGFDVGEQLPEQVGHFGLTSMRERSQIIGAELEIISEPENGTRVALTLPLGADGQEA